LILRLLAREIRYAALALAVSAGLLRNQSLSSSCFVDFFWKNKPQVSKAKNAYYRSMLRSPARICCQLRIELELLYFPTPAGATTGTLESAATKRWRSASGLQPLEVARDSRRFPRDRISAKDTATAANTTTAIITSFVSAPFFTDLVKVLICPESEFI
jgi:hypothetical protein